MKSKLFLSLIALVPSLAAAALDTAKIETATGLKGTFNEAEGLNIVAIHQHMTMEEPRYLFLHYWGKGKALDLAKAVKSALGTQSK